MILLKLFPVLFATGIVAEKLSDTNYKEGFVVSFNGTQNGIEFKSVYGDKIFFSARIGIGIDFTNIDCLGHPNCTINDDITFDVEGVDNGYRLRWISKNTKTVFRDCYDLEGEWYGGPQRTVQEWPVQNITLSGSRPYISTKTDNSAVSERYWLTSKGGYLYLDERNPLFVSQNEADSQRQICFVTKLESPYINRTRNILDYLVVYLDDLRSSHLHAINYHLGKPRYHPNSQMIAEPIFTTWAKYKRDIDDATVLEFAQSIKDHGYDKGQLEIDDAWEKCYGAQEFSTDKFPKISETVKKIKDLGYRVTLWIHPFVNDDCQNNTQEGIDNDFFVKGANGMNNASWWNGDKIAHQIDFTNKKAAAWWTNRLRKLLDDPQIDGYKFDAGESDYAEQPSVYPHVDQELIPNILTADYIRTCEKFGDLIEVRSAWRTQDLPIFVRMLDKDTNWGLSNGLKTLITTLFQLNLSGYTMVLPDMIGGNGYSGESPTAELLVRWTQANTFMPAMQFSYLPWEITSSEFDAPAIVKSYVELHEKYADKIIKAMKNSVDNGSPVNAPIWWIAPTDPIALACSDEYLLGEDILVAPVVDENSRSRLVYLPAGVWRDGQNGSVYQGPTTLDYAADIDILPYFLKEEA